MCKNLESALIISHTMDEMTVLEEVLRSFSCEQITFSRSSQECKSLSLKHPYDLYLLFYAPHKDMDENLAKELASGKVSQVLLFVESEIQDKVAKSMENFPVIVLEKDFKRENLVNCFRFLKVSSDKLKKLQTENAKLEKKLHDIAFINRAKFILISQLKMSETSAHKFIEKEAMNTRTSKLTVAKKILKTYDF